MKNIIIILLNVLYVVGMFHMGWSDWVLWFFIVLNGSLLIIAVFLPKKWALRKGWF